MSVSIAARPRADIAFATDGTGVYAFLEYPIAPHGYPPPMDVTASFEPKRRSKLRAWFEKNHATAREIWIVYPRPRTDEQSITYLDVVEEALCFGWIDSTAKRHDEVNVAQRLSPRKAKSNWTELNKDRARRLIASGKMTPAGAAVLPDLTLTPLLLPSDLKAALRKAKGALAFFDGAPDMYRRIRVAHITDPKALPEEREKRITKLVAASAKGLILGNWDDSSFPVTCT